MLQLHINFVFLMSNVQAVWVDGHRWPRYTLFTGDCPVQPEQMQTLAPNSPVAEAIMSEALKAEPLKSMSTEATWQKVLGMFGNQPFQVITCYIIIFTCIYKYIRL